MTPTTTLPARWRRSRGFTLVELLTVIAIIAILSAILVPIGGTAIKKVKDAKTRVLLSNLVEMSKQYKEMYKLWPTFANPSLNADTAIKLTDLRPRFVQIMTGNPDTPDLKYNKTKTCFATFNDADLSPDPSSSTPIDAFGNDDLDLVFNTNLSTPNQIDPGVVNSISMVSAEAVTVQLSPQQSSDVPINQPCVALSPGLGQTNSDVITTWDVVPQGATAAGQ
jgi:prepilin-type N-terminal cleavage/methylation domain-containing protein